MKNKEYIVNLLLIGLITLSFSAMSAVATAQYYRHLAVVHHAAFYEADSWGKPSFHWNDVSFAQAPFQDPSDTERKIQEASQKRLNSLGIK
jgi:hypothetical protein